MYEVHVRQRHVPMPFEPEEEVEASLYARFEGVLLCHHVNCHPLSGLAASVLLEFIVRFM